MKKILKVLGIFITILIIAGVGFYFFNNESLPEGEKGTKAETLAKKMAEAINYEAFKNTEVLEWSFAGQHHYKWLKEYGIVEVSWENNKVIYNTKDKSESTVYINGTAQNNPEVLQQAVDFFNNDSFWLVAPYKIFDSGTERRYVNYEGKDALLITYTSGGSTPGDSYLWILDQNQKPESFKMWTSIIPIGGVSATWSDWKKAESGILLPKKHTLSLFGLEIDMGDVKAYNSRANMLARNILDAINHEAYKKTKFIEWSFGGRRNFKWNKEEHTVDVSWGEFKVNLYPSDIDKSTVYFKGEKEEVTDEKIIKRAWDIFNNDSFWLVGPHKLFDDGVIRTIVTHEGKEALQVKYTSGGTTPGDSYIWIVNDNYLPTKFLMTVPSMKMNQVPATWEDWITTESGTMLPKNHTFNGGRTLSMGDVKAYN